MAGTVINPGRESYNCHFNIGSVFSIHIITRDTCSSYPLPKNLSLSLLFFSIFFPYYYHHHPLSPPLLSFAADGCYYRYPQLVKMQRTSYYGGFQLHNATLQLRHREHHEIGHGMILRTRRPKDLW